jgi:hypothetical protein
MADWRQIQARIRKAKTSSDPPAQLAELYERTRDGMVAFELAQWHEKAGNASETVQWYTAAAQRFRRAQWRTKAEEALTRLGAPIPEASQVAPPRRTAEAAGSAAAGEADLSPAPADIPYDPAIEAEEVDRERSRGPVEAQAAPSEAAESSNDVPPASASAGVAANAAALGKRRRRGRRGGRKRRGRGAGAAQQQTGPAASRAEGAPVAAVRQSRTVAERSRPSAPFGRPPGGETSSERSFAAEAETLTESHGTESRPAATTWQGGSPGPISSRSRAGDPGLSSRIAGLESQLRRLLACSLSSLDDADQAPAGPGVLLLSDSDQVTHYYVEACQTLRIGVGNLLRGGRGSKTAAQLKPSLAEHLGIDDSRVAKYMKDHCAVRWIQLDEGAADLAHFAMAVLRPVVNE